MAASTFLFRPPSLSKQQRCPSEEGLSCARMWERSHEILLHSRIMDAQLRLQIIHAVALREGTARELAERFNMPVPALRAFVAEHEDSIRHIAEEAEWEAQNAAEEAARAKDRRTRLVAAGFEETNSESAFPESVVSPADLDELWISKKTERLKRYQIITDQLFNACVAQDRYGLTDATTLRELRSFMRYAAEELGQLLHRGSGDMPENSTVNYTLPGVSMEDLT